MSRKSSKCFAGYKINEKMTPLWAIQKIIDCVGNFGLKWRKKKEIK